jgi:heme/copper-type cytochrome/quinol oxidase subunit 2
MRYFHHPSKPGMTFAHRQTLAAAWWGIPMLLLALIGIPKRYWVGTGEVSPLPSSWMTINQKLSARLSG